MRGAKEKLPNLSEELLFIMILKRRIFVPYQLDKRSTTMEKVEFTQGILAIQPDLHRFAYKLTADRDSANDLVQDCVLQALDNQEKFTYSKNLKGWMYTLMRNIFVNNYRRTVREMNLIDDSYSINQQHLIEDEDADRFEFTYDMKQLYRVIHSCLLYTSDAADD